MKKETVNLFNKGLNYDLNPLTTPNDVLTDCLNGTFVTFNGDELILQNDAGNTKIKASDWTVENPKYVKLKENYYPIGIKEYGGILYIVSTDGTNVEFGSYPSPDVYKEGGAFIGNQFIIDENISNFYKSFILNDNLFTAGTSATFKTNTESELSNFSLYALSGDALIKIKRWYNLKLVQLLDNGKIDLTENIWRKFRTTGEGDHWINPTSDFKYYCPNNFKGKLAVEMEIEELDEFKIIDVNIDSELIFTIQVSAENQTGWTIAGAAVKIKLDDGGWTEYSSTLLDESNIWVYEGAIPPNINIIYYEITPKLYYPSTTYEISEFPIEYQKKYTLLGQFSTNSGIVDLKISLSEEDFDCDEGYKVYNKIKISDLQGNKINPFTSKPSDFYYYLYSTSESGYESQQDYAGHFTITNSFYPEYITFADGIKNQPYLRSELNKLQIKISSDLCTSGAELTIKSTDITNFDTSATFIQIYQGSELITRESFATGDVTVNVIPDVDAFISMLNPPSWTIPLNNMPVRISTNKTVKIAPELKFYIETRLTEGILTDYLKLDRSLNSGLITLTITFGTYTLSQALGASVDIPLINENNSNWAASRNYTVVSNAETPVSSEDFINLSNSSDYYVYGPEFSELAVKKTQILSSKLNPEWAYPI